MKTPDDVTQWALKPVHDSGKWWGTEVVLTIRRRVYVRDQPGQSHEARTMRVTAMAHDAAAELADQIAEAADERTAVESVVLGDWAQFVP